MMDLDLYSYEIKEFTRDENVAVGAWNLANHDVVRWARTGQNDQRFVVVPVEGTNKVRLITLREDVGERRAVAIEPNGGAITWGKTDDGSDLFEMIQVGDRVAFKESTRGEYLDVDYRTGRMQRWEGDNGKPKENQLFQLTNKKPFPYMDDESESFLKKHAGFSRDLMKVICNANLSEQELNLLGKIDATQLGLVAEVLKPLPFFKSYLARIQNGGDLNLTASEAAALTPEKSQELAMIIGGVIGIVVAIIGVIIAIIGALLLWAFGFGTAALGLGIVLIVIGVMIIVFSVVLRIPFGEVIRQIEKWFSSSTASLQSERPSREAVLQNASNIGLNLT
ncbi:hypothetical protein KFE98_02945 [bacterium SCSIO 12741]|nr:hypothetical protein KFE98_02945 [bacterium SCSIO 12741]